MRTSVSILLSLSLAGLFTGEAAAVPPSPSQVQAKAKAAQPSPTWTRATFLQEVTPGKPATLALRIAISPSGTIRQDVQRLVDGHAIETLTWAPTSVDITGARPLAEAPGWLLVLAGRPLAEVVRDKAVGSVTSFAHDGSTILWVLGAGPHEPERPQLHVERETGRLRRFTERLTTDAGAVAVTVRLAWRETSEPGAAETWPIRLEITPAGGKTVAFLRRTLSLGEPVDDLLAPGPPGAEAPAPPRAP